MQQIIIQNPEQFLVHIPEILQAKGEKLLYLHGQLGAGKTTFVKQLGKFLGVQRPIVSPTFTYIREYKTAAGKTLHHLDLYRFSGNLEDIISLHQLNETDIVCIEWAELVPELAQYPHLDLTLSYNDETTRTLTW